MLITTVGRTEFKMELLSGSRGGWALPASHSSAIGEVLESQPDEQAGPQDDRVWRICVAKPQNKTLSREASAGYS